MPESRNIGKSIKRNKQISSQDSLKKMEISSSPFLCLITLTVLFSREPTQAHLEPVSNFYNIPNQGVLV